MPLRPLEGFVVGITADRRRHEQADLLQRRGATVLHGPSVATEYLASDERLRQATAKLIEQPPQYLVANTGVGMRAWFEACRAWGLFDRLIEALGATATLARGPKAASALQAVGLTVGTRAASEQLAEIQEILLREPLRGRRVAVQLHGHDGLPMGSALAAGGAHVVELPVYRWLPPPDPAPVLRLIGAACEGSLDAISFTSAPALDRLFATAADHSLEDDLRQALNTNVVAACIGPVCAERARDQGVTQPLAPSVGRLGLLVRALSEHLAERRRTVSLIGTEVTFQGSALCAGEMVVHLTPHERAVFRLLAARPGGTVSSERLLKEALGSAGADPHRLHVTVARLRRRLGPYGGALVTMPRRGYRLEPATQGPTRKSPSG